MRGKKKRRRGLHIGVLILGAYLLFLGGGTLLVNLAELWLGNRDGIVIARAVLGAVMACGGVCAVWDAVRDLLPSKKREEFTPSVPFIFTGTDGVRSSNITAELLHEQISRISEGAWHVSLQPAAPMPLAGLGELVKLDCALMEDGMFLVAVFRLEDDSFRVLRKPSEAGEAEAVMAALLEAKAPDFTAWEALEAAPRQPEPDWPRRLVLFRDSGTNDHEFFTERDLDLTVTGLEDGTYRRALVQIGPMRIAAAAATDGSIVLYLQIQVQDGVRAFRRAGTPAQVRFWLVQFYDGSLFQAPLEGWEAVDCESR